MEYQFVCSEAAELERLSVQSRLLLPLEAPVIDGLIAGRRGLNVLDVGCGSGGKTLRRFSDPAFAKIIGLEYSGERLREAAERCSDSRFAFYPADADDPDFSDRLRNIMEENGVPSFEVIYLSLILMHLRSPETLLRSLRDVLSPDGVLVIVEADDGGCRIEPDDDGLLDGFLRILRRDPYAGERIVGDRLRGMLGACGMTVLTEKRGICASPEDRQKKEDIFEVFFSYLPEDVRLLREAAPENRQAAEDEKWLRERFDELRRRILSPDTAVVMGVRLIACRRD